MSSSLGSGPTKGALVALDPYDPLASVVVFQYNPAELARTLEPQFASGGHTPAGTQFLAGPPTETIRLSIDVNAADQLERGDAVTKALGVYPALASIEMAMSPKTLQVAKILRAAAMGLIEVAPQPAPLTLFIWGWKRVQPVQIISYSVTETLHDGSLNPTAAKVDLGLRVLTFQDFPTLSAGLVLSMAQLAMKEAFAVTGSFKGSIDAIKSKTGGG